MNTDPIDCPFCGRSDRQVKAGMHNGIQRYKCMYCMRRYIPSQHRGYPDEIRNKALELYAAGMKIRQIGRQLNLNPSSIGNWIRSAEIEGGKTAATLSVQAPIKNRTGVIGVIIHHYISLEVVHPDNMGPVLMSGINYKAETLGYDLRIYTGWPNRRRFSGDEFSKEDIDGLIWVAPEIEPDEISHIRDTKLPVVSLLSRHVPENTGYVVVDNIGGIRSLVSYLVSIGHRRIAYVGPNNSSDFIDRLEGYRQGLRDQNIPFDPDLLAANEAISSNWITIHMKDYEEALIRLLNLKDKPTAILFAYDVIAIWSMNFLKSRNINIPEDLAVTGFDNLPCSQTTSGDLTTVHQPFREIGITGMDRLNALIQGEPVERCRIVIPARIVVRGSTISTAISAEYHF